MRYSKEGRRRRVYSSGMNNGFNSKFPEDYQQKTPEEGWRVQQLKHEYEDEDNSLNIINNNS